MSLPSPLLISKLVEKGNESPLPWNAIVIVFRRKQEVRIMHVFPLKPKSLQLIIKVSTRALRVIPAVNQTLDWILKSGAVSPISGAQPCPWVEPRPRFCQQGHLSQPPVFFCPKHS